MHWLKDYADPANYLEPLASRARITASDNANLSLLGLTPRLARRFGVGGAVAHVPSVDADLTRCEALGGVARLDCYSALDRRLTAEIVAWVPFLWRNQIGILGPQVARWQFDQVTGVTAFAHVALKR